ncbi:cell division protein FtsK, partial [Streptococcus pyogenes]
MPLYTYRGLKVHKFYRSIRVLTAFLMLVPFFIGAGCYYYPIYQEVIYSPIHYLPSSLLLVGLPCVLVPIFNWMLYQKVLFFKRLNSLRILANFLLENRYYLSKTIRRNNRTTEKIILPKVYLRQTNYQLLVSFILEGNKF